MPARARIYGGASIKAITFRERSFRLPESTLAITRAIGGRRQISVSGAKRTSLSAAACTRRPLGRRNGLSSRLGRYDLGCERRGCVSVAADDRKNDRPGRAGSPNGAAARLSEARRCKFVAVKITTLVTAVLHADLERFIRPRRFPHPDLSHLSRLSSPRVRVLNLVASPASARARRNTAVLTRLRAITFRNSPAPLSRFQIDVDEFHYLESCAFAINKRCVR